jgi:hypothetical protein
MPAWPGAAPLQRNSWALGATVCLRNMPKRYGSQRKRKKVRGAAPQGIQKQSFSHIFPYHLRRSYSLLLHQPRSYVCQIAEAPTRRSARLAAVGSGEPSAVTPTEEEGAPPWLTSAPMVETAQSPRQTPASPVSLPDASTDAPAASTFRLRTSPLEGDGFTVTMEGGFYEGRKSSVEGGDDLESEGGDGNSDDNNALHWPPELLHRPLQERRRLLPKTGARHGIGVGQHVQVEGATENAQAQLQSAGDSWVERDDDGESQGLAGRGTGEHWAGDCAGDGLGTGLLHPPDLGFGGAGFQGPVPWPGAGGAGSNPAMVAGPIMGHAMGSVWGWEGVGENVENRTCTVRATGGSKVQRQVTQLSEDSYDLLDYGTDDENTNTGDPILNDVR